MRSVIVLLIGIFITAFTVTDAKAQTFLNNGEAEPDVREVQLGVRAGLSLYSVNSELTTGMFGTASSSSGYTAGFAGGLFLIIPLSDRFSFQPELLFVQKGGSEADDFTGDDDFFDDADESEEGSITLNYIELPLLARFNLPLDGEALPYVVAGPSLGYLLGADISNGDEEEELADFYRSFNAGLILGAGINYRNFTADVRFDIGLTNIFDDSDLFSEFENDEFDDFFDDLFGEIEVTQKTSGFQITIGVLF